jgi:hypothetical protein
MQFGDGDRGLGGRGYPQEAGPPARLLAAGCAAMILAIGGLVAGGPIGTALAAWGYLIVLTLATVFFCLLALRQVRRRSR